MGVAFTNSTKIEPGTLSWGRLCYRVNDAAIVLGVCRNTVYDLGRRGELEIGTLAGRTVIRRDELERFLAARQAEAPTPPTPEPEPEATPAPRCGVYLLCAGGSVVYVGRSTHLRSRLATHRASGRPFDEVRIIPCDAETANWLERELVRTLQPPQNVHRFKRHAKAIERTLSREGLH